MEQVDIAPAATDHRVSFQDISADVAAFQVRQYEDIYPVPCE